jgi:prophage tail gpP-like protein
VVYAKDEKGTTSKMTLMPPAAFTFQPYNIK